MLSNISRYAAKKCVTRRVLRHVLYIAANQLHGVSAIAAEQAVMIVRFRGTAINDSNEVICYDDSVLAFLFGVLRDECLLENYHF